MVEDDVAPGLPGGTRQWMPVAVAPALRAVWTFSVRAFRLVHFPFVVLVLVLRYQIGRAHV